MTGRSSRRLVVAYGLVLAYGTLYPLSGWRLPGRLSWEILPGWLGYSSRTDSLTNLVLYVPLGLFLAFALGARQRAAFAVVGATAVAASLSLVLETLQGLLPARVSSLSDLALNTLGALAGAVAASALTSFSSSRRTIHGLKQRWMKAGVRADLGCSVIALWALSQLSPLVPSLDIGYLREGLRPAWTTLNDLSRFELHQAVTYGLAICGLGLLSSLFVKNQVRSRVAFLVLVFAVLFSKVPVLTRQLSLEALAGSAVGFLLFLLLQNTSKASLPLLATGFVLGFFVFDGLRAGASSTAYSPIGQLNWLPFRNYQLNLYDLADIMGTAWAPLALAYLVRHRLARPSAAIAIAGAFLVFAVALAVEWTQRWLPGRTPDVTDCLVAVAAWLVPWIWPGPRKRSKTLSARSAAAGF